MAGVACLKSQDLRPGEGTVVEVNGRSIAVFNLDGSFYALDNACPHRGGPLAEGELEDGKVVCPWHGFRFDVKSGACAKPEAYCVTTYPATVVGDQVLLDLA